MPARSFVIVLALICSPLYSQETFYTIDGSKFLPDTATIVKLGIKEIHRETRKKYEPTRDGYYYLNDNGCLDSIISWSSDDDDKLLCTSKEYFQFDHKRLLQRHFYHYFNTFSSGGEDGNQWLPCKVETHYSYFYNPVDNLIDNSHLNSREILKLEHDSIEISFTKVNLYFSNDTLIRDHIHKTNVIDNDAFVIENYLYNKDGLLSEILRDTCSNGNCSYHSKTIYQYNEDRQRISQLYFSDKKKSGELVRSWRYDKQGRLSFEELKKTIIGVKSRTYSYDSKNRLSKIKEKHFDGFIVRYKIRYDSIGLLQKIIAKHKFGNDIQNFTYVIK